MGNMGVVVLLVVRKQKGVKRKNRMRVVLLVVRGKR